MTLPPPRKIGAVNWIGTRTLVWKEVLRFLKVWMQTTIAPVVTTLIFLSIFTLALGRSMQVLGGVSFVEFLAPGLIMMAIIQNAYANTAGSVMMAKIQGNIIDLLMPPISPGELTLGLALGGMLRGVMVAILVGIALAFFVPLEIKHPAVVLYYALSAALMLALIGLLTGIVAEKFDQQATVSNFVIMPLSFLSGTFYSIERLPPFWQDAVLFNPFFYMIDGFRFGFIDHADAPLAYGIAVTVAINAALWATCHIMIARGYKLKT